MGELRDGAEDEAISVFARNLHDLLLAAPAGLRATMGLDPGLRTGVKVAVVDATGKLLTPLPSTHTAEEPVGPDSAVLAALCAKHKVELIAIGNGTASRETDMLPGELIKKYPGMKLTGRSCVSEAGASCIPPPNWRRRSSPSSTCPCAAPVSIARRLQDPLAELVKIEPKSIGVGQYQHDVPAEAGA
ncbi:hypothetical protein ACPA9J_19885 [Pseudomonas aeruginosa]